MDKYQELIKAVEKNTAALSSVDAMLVTLWEQSKKETLLLQRLLDKEPIKLTTQQVTFPSVMQTELLNPTEEVAITKPDWFTLPNFKAYFDALSTENAKGQFAIIDAVDRLTEFLKSIDWSKLKENKVSDFGGTFTPSWKIETPSGSINGSNRIFTLTMTPKQNSLFLFLGGMLQTENEDYTISRNTITYTNAPPEGVTPHVARFQV